MWDRVSIKKYAKKFLAKHYLKALLVCVIVLLLGGSIGSGSRSNDSNSYNNEDSIVYKLEEKVASKTDNSIVNYLVKGFKPPLTYLTVGKFAIVTNIMIILLITVGFVIEVGMCRFFLRSFKGDVNVKTVFSVFNSKEYISILTTQFLRMLYNFLWGFVFIIPAIIKYYEYRFIPYILAEEPNLSTNIAIQRSRQMTKGHKVDMFILDLSFFGWLIVGVFFYGIGTIFVQPYIEASFARLYNILSANDDLEQDYDVIAQ